MKSEMTYWMALAHAEGLTTKRKNEIVVACFNRGVDLDAVFAADSNSLESDFSIAREEISLIYELRDSLPKYSFAAEDLLNQGFRLIPVTSSDYPVALKKNLKYGSPILLYAKGDTALLNEPSVAVVGSRSAQKISLEFTDAVARSAVAQGKVVVSGYAKGVDRQAFDSAMQAGGKSIIVLPQGISTFGAGYQANHRFISTGRCLVISPFAPTAPWTVGFAMARNPIIYGLGQEIFVAESDSKGGTFAGVQDGLRKKREIFVRLPEENEKCANLLLIDMGAKAVDMQGNPVEVSSLKEREEKLRKFLTGHRRTAKEIALHIFEADDKATQTKVRKLLERFPEIQKLKGSPVKYNIPVADFPTSLFSAEPIQPY